MDTCCTICGRVKWGNWVVIPGGKFRHDECGLGSENWKAYYLALNPAAQRPLREFFNFTYSEEGMQS